MATISPPFGGSAPDHGDASSIPALRSFPLLRWFALLSAVVVGLVLTAAILFISHLVEQSSVRHDADLLAGLVNGLVEAEGMEHFFLRQGQPDQTEEAARFVARLGGLPGVLRANVYGLDRTVLWSTEPRLIGRRFPANDELEVASTGTVVASLGTIGAPGDKPEHAQFGQPGSRYLESYLPVWSPEAAPRVIGVVEFYREPLSFLAMIRGTQERIWWSALAAATVLYLAMLLIVARAGALMRCQQVALVAAEKLAATGEMASAVAHGLRNPLASIRSSAELGLEIDDPRESRELHAEVVAQADRLEGWIRRFLTAARAGTDGQAPTDTRAVIADCTAQLALTLARRGVTLEVAVPDRLSPVGLGAVLLGQVLNSVLANAVEAMANGGRLSVGAAVTGHDVTIEVGDTGPGMSAAELEAALSPFATTKPAGLGLGLPIARETVERHGGRFSLESRPGVGTTVRLVLPAVPNGGAA